MAVERPAKYRVEIQQVSYNGFSTLSLHCQLAFERTPGWTQVGVATRTAGWQPERHLSLLQKTSRPPGLRDKLDNLPSQLTCGSLRVTIIFSIPMNRAHSMSHFSVRQASESNNAIQPDTFSQYVKAVAKA